MAGILTVALCIGVVGAAAAVLGSRVRRAGPRPEPPRALAVRTTAWRWAGVAVGLSGAWVAVELDRLGRGVMLAAPTLALGVLAGVLVGELGVRAPRGSTRSAELAPRRVRDYLPPRLTPLVGAATAVLLLVLATTTAMGAPDDLGRAGRVLSLACNGALSGTHGPWPGSYYSVPLTAVVLLGLAVAGLALRRITVRPRPDAPDLVGPGDDEARRRAARATVAAGGLLVTLPLTGVSVVAAMSLLSFSCRPPSWTIGGAVLLALTPLWVALLGWCAVTVLAPVSSAPPLSPSGTPRRESVAP